jgi:RNA polymerase sigma-70 factor (ECF subfamily)
MAVRREALARECTAEARILPGDFREFGEVAGEGLPRGGRPLSWPRLVKHGIADQTNREGAPRMAAASPVATWTVAPRASQGAWEAAADSASLAAAQAAVGNACRDAKVHPGPSLETASDGARDAEPHAGSPQGSLPDSGSSAERSRIVGDLYRANYHRVFGFARRLVGEDEAEEVAHEAFCRLLKVRNLERMTISTAYLLRIAENLIRRKYERAQRYRVVLERSGMVVSERTEDARMTGQPGGAGSREPEEIRLDSARLASVLRRLTSEEQSAVRLIVCEGLDYQAAARSLGVPVSTINNWKYRGLAKLRQLIDDSPAPRDGCHSPGHDRVDRLAEAV